MRNCYVIQTKTNEEEKLVQMIEKLIPGELYEECFVPKYENVWKLQGMNLVDKVVLFPGYVFIITGQPEEVYMRLKQIPKLSKMLGESTERSEKYFVAISEQEWEFLENILDMSDYTMYRSVVKRNERGIIEQAEGPLKAYVDKIVKVDYPHRRLLIEMDLFGQKRRIKFCFMSEEDCRKEQRPMPEWKEQKPFDYKAGETIMLLSEAYEHQEFVIKKVNEKKRTVAVEVEMFGRPMELTVEEYEIEKKV